MRKQRKNLVVIIAVAFVIGLGVFLAVWGGFLAPKPQAFTPHYLAYQGVESNIYSVAETTSYTYADKTYTSSDGQTVAAGSGIFTINLTLRNDYSSDNPPPTSGTPVSPIDGTAYIRLKATLFSNNVSVPTVNISPSDFPAPVDQTGLVLASGQTVNAQLQLATDQTNITGYIVALEFVGDSIPS